MGNFKLWNTQRFEAAASGPAGSADDMVARAAAAAAQADADSNAAAIAALDAEGENHGAVADITARDALTAGSGDRVIVIDASADATVDAGAASYVYDGTAWIKYAEDESLDLDVPDLSGGTALQILQKASAADKDFAWVDLPTPPASIAAALVEVKDSADAGTVKWALVDGLFEYVIPQADHGIPVGRRVAGISAFNTATEEFTDVEIVHSKATGDITIRSVADIAVDLEILGVSQ